MTLTNPAFITVSACDIIYRLANVRGEKTSEQIGTSLVAEDLVQITYKFHAKVLESAVRALSSIALGQEAAGEEDSLFYRKVGQRLEFLSNVHTNQLASISLLLDCSVAITSQTPYYFVSSLARF